MIPCLSDVLSSEASSVASAPLERILKPRWLNVQQLHCAADLGRHGATWTRWHAIQAALVLSTTAAGGLDCYVVMIDICFLEPHLLASMDDGIRC